MLKYSEEEIKEAVDIAIGDDGFRSKEVIEILKVMKREIIGYRFAGVTYKKKSDCPISDPRPIYKQTKEKK